MEGSSESAEVSDVAVGCYHSVLVTSGGVAMTTGYNGAGQLGTGHRGEQRNSFVAVKFKRSVKISAVHCCIYSSYFLTAEGQVGCADVI